MLYFTLVLEGDILNLIKALTCAAVFSLLAACSIAAIFDLGSIRGTYDKCRIKSKKLTEAIVHNQVSGKYYQATSPHSQSDAKKQAMIGSKSAKVGRSVKNACVAFHKRIITCQN